MWDEKYCKQEYHYGTAPNDFLVEAEPFWNSKKKSLCLGAGEGRNEVYLLEKGLHVTALDLSEVGLKKFCALAESRDLKSFETVHSKLEEFDFGDRSFDFITAIWFHGSKALKDSVFTVVSKYLESGGLLLMEVYTPKQVEFGTGGPPSAGMMYTLGEVESHLSDLDPLILQEKIRDVREGVGHNGKSSVLQLLARKN